MPRVYTVEFEQGTLATASGDHEFFELLAADDKPIAIKNIVIKPTSEIAEAQEEWIRLRIIRGHTTAGTGGSTATPRPTSPIDTAAGFTAATMRTAVASAGTAVNLWSDAFQVRVGYELFRGNDWSDWFWTSGTEYLVVRAMAAGADDILLNGTIDVVEFP